MTGNPKGSDWYSTPRTERKRKGTQLTLSPEAVERLEKLAERRKMSKSKVVEELVMAAPLRFADRSHTSAPIRSRALFSSGALRAQC